MHDVYLRLIQLRPPMLPSGQFARSPESIKRCSSLTQPLEVLIVHTGSPTHTFGGHFDYA